MRGRTSGASPKVAAVLLAAALAAGCSTTEDAAPAPTTRSLTVATFPRDGAAPAPLTLPPPQGFEDRVAITANVPYTSTQRAFDLYRPRQAAGVPLVVLFGGRATDKSLYGQVAASLAAQGVVVAVPNYNAPLDAPADEARCAIGAIGDFVATKLGEPSAVVLAGFSFGAVVAVGEGLGGPWSAAAVDSTACPAPAPTRPVRAVVGLAGDYDRFGRDGLGDPTWSPYQQVAATAVPVRLVHGSRDALDIGPDVSEAFADALEAAGHPFELRVEAEVPNLALAGLGLDPATGQLAHLDAALDHRGVDIAVEEILAAIG